MNVDPEYDDQPLRREAGSEATPQIDLVSWLTQQIDHDEQVARDVLEDFLGPQPSRAGVAVFMRACRWTESFTPARVLRQVAAYRRILDWHEPCDDGYRDVCMVCGVPSPCLDLRNVASIYSDREGYDPSWTVE